jgi:formate-dependent phosphoribosylglycinamide formyltransferase (GAR transformylase)
MNKATVIIGFAEALSAPEVAWSLVDHGFEVVAFTRSGRRAALKQSRYVRVFEVAPPEMDVVRTEQDLRAAIDSIRASSSVPVAIMPLDDQALWLCGRTGIRGAGVFVGPKSEALDMALDKEKQVQIAQTAGFPVPAYSFVDRPEEVSEQKINFPVVFKPTLAAVQREGTLSRGHGWTCADWTELKSAVGKWAGQGRMFLQQFVTGVGEGIFGLATDRGVLAWTGHRRVRMMNPQGSGSSACTPVPHLDEQCKASAERFVQDCGWRGLFMIEMLRDDSGKLWFMEFNGRAWGSMALARRLGFEYPAWAVQMALDPNASLEIPPPTLAVPVCRHLAREILHVLFVLRGSHSKALVHWPSIWTTLSEVCRIGRHDCWYNWRNNDPKVFVSDCFGSLWAQIVGARTP